MDPQDDTICGNTTYKRGSKQVGLIFVLQTDLIHSSRLLSAWVFHSDQYPPKLTLLTFWLKH